MNSEIKVVLDRNTVNEGLKKAWGSGYIDIIEPSLKELFLKKESIVKKAILDVTGIINISNWDYIKRISCLNKSDKSETWYIDGDVGLVVFNKPESVFGEAGLTLSCGYRKLYRVKGDDNG